MKWMRLLCALLLLPAYDQTRTPRAELAAGVIDVRRLGAVCDGADTAADTPAFASALAQATTRAYGSVIRVPAGRCLLSAGLEATLHGNQALSIQGDGPDVSELVFTADVDGLAIVLNSANAWLRGNAANTTGAVFRMSGLSFVRALPTEGRTAMTISSTAAANPGSRQVKLEGVVVRGDGAGGAFRNGIVLSRISTALVDDFSFHAAWRAGSTGAGVTMSSVAGMNAGGLNVTRAEIDGARTCYVLGEYLQGITISNSSCVGAQDGILATSASGSNDLIASTTSHWDVHHSVVTSSGWNSLTFVNNYILANDAAAVNDFTAFDITNGARHHLTGNHILGRGDSTAMRFVRIANTTAFDSQMAMDVVGNAGDGMTGGFVTIAGQTANAMVVGNYCNTCGPFASDARGLSKFMANSINGEMLLFGMAAGKTGAAIAPAGGEARGRLNVADCPSSAKGLASGDLWCNGTVVNRVP